METSGPVETGTKAVRAAIFTIASTIRLLRGRVIFFVAMLLAGLPVVAQQPPAATTAPDQGLQEIVVTGSLIRRTDTETPSPVQILTGEDLLQSGYTTVSDILRNLSANGQGTLSQSFNGAFASGGAGVALRGLTVGGTLTLIDGHRMVGYPLTDDGERNFVDVTEIPFSAVERVEVLKDGASAEYGSDAIAGVVNIILRKTYTGGELTAEIGDSSHNDGRMNHVTGLWGVGDLASDGYNLWATAEYRHQDDILVANRSGAWNSVDFTPYGGNNLTPGGGTDPAAPFPESLTGYLINPATGAIGAFFPGCNATALANNQCAFTFKGLELQPQTSNANLLAKFSLKLGNWQSVTTASVFQSIADQQINSGYQNTDNVINPTNLGGPSVFFPFPTNGLPSTKTFPVITVPANYPGNPYGVAAELIYSFPELGIAEDDLKTNTYRLVEELNGNAAGWDLDVSAGYMYAVMDQLWLGYIAPALLQNALNNGYVLGSANAAAEFAPPASNKDTSALIYGNAHGSRSIAVLPGGELALAVGAEYFEKKLNDPSAAASASGLQGMTNAWSVGSQADTAAFVELDAPLLKNLEVNVSGRYDHYNTSAGGEPTPKIGVKYTPVSELALRGTWGKGFRAPSIPETNSGLSFQASSVNDPVLCPNPANSNAPGNFPSQCSVGATGVQTSGTNLKPELTTNYTLGFVFEPVKQLSIAADYYDIKVDRDIISAFEAGGLGINATTLVRGSPETLPFVNPDGTISNKLTPVGLAVYTAYPYINASSTHTNGVDLDLKSHFDLGSFGQISAQLNYTHIISFTLSAKGVSYDLAGTHGPSGFSGDTGNPKDRATASLSWDRGPLTITGSLNYVGSFNVTDPSAGQPTCAIALESTFDSEYGPAAFQSSNSANFSPSLCTVHSFTDFDFYARYNFTANLAVHASVLNAFNQPPPLDAVTYGGGGGSPYDAALHEAGAVGRYLTVGATYKF